MAKTDKTENMIYLITGATGHLGRNLTEALLERGEEVRAFVLPGEEEFVPEGARVITGDVTEAASLRPLFERQGSGKLCLLHCAARITIATRRDPQVWRVNVHGTKNVMRAASEAGAERVVHVSSVHAIPERPAPEVITEPEHYSSSAVRGQYAKSKAAAAEMVRVFAARGLNASIVLPSGILGPGDIQNRNHMVRTVRAIAQGKLPASVRGGYDFVDARDLTEGVLACARDGRRGESYIMNGHVISVRELMEMVSELTDCKVPRVDLAPAVAKAVAPAAELFARATGTAQPILTPYSVYTLGTNANFSHEKASAELGYTVRDLRETVADTL